MKSRLAQLRSDLTVSGVLAITALALVAAAFFAPTDRTPQPPQSTQTSN